MSFDEQLWIKQCKKRYNKDEQKGLKYLDIRFVKTLQDKYIIFQLNMVNLQQNGNT